jgi:hypothetical protein
MVRDVVQPKDLKNKEKGNVAFKAINYSELIPVLTKALQEQNALIDELNQRIINLENNTTNGSAKKQNRLTDKDQNITTLYQNNPNPFYEKTTIHYNIPLTCKKASIRIMNMEGKELQNISIAKNGEGQVIISANTLPAGTYIYQLVTDESVSITRKMILAR